MKVMMRLMALLFTLAVSGAQAQTAAPAKPAAKPAAAKASAAKPAASAATSSEGKTAVMGSGKGNSGPILTRDELRVCLKQEEIIRTKLDEHTAKRAPLDKEKADLTVDQNALKTDRAPLDEFKKQAEALSAKFKDYGVRIKAYEERIIAFNSVNPTGTKGERERTALAKEREGIDADRKALETEKADFEARSEAAVKAYNAKASAVDARVSDWNQRNEAWNQAARALETERGDWVSTCADRRYREDDEIAIKRGK